MSKEQIVNAIQEHLDKPTCSDRFFLFAVKAALENSYEYIPLKKKDTYEFQDI